MNNNGIMRGDKQIKLTPERSVLKLNIGDPIKLTEESSNVSQWRFSLS